MLRRLMMRPIRRASSLAPSVLHRHTSVYSSVSGEPLVQEAWVMQLSSVEVMVMMRGERPASVPRRKTELNDCHRADWVVSSLAVQNSFFLASKNSCLLRTAVVRATKILSLNSYRRTHLSLPTRI